MAVRRSSSVAHVTGAECKNLLQKPLALRPRSTIIPDPLHVYSGEDAVMLEFSSTHQDTGLLTDVEKPLTIHAM